MNKFGTLIEKLPEKVPELSLLKDIEYFQNKIMESTTIPENYFMRQDGQWATRPAVYYVPVPKGMTAEQFAESINESIRKWNNETNYDRAMKVVSAN